MTFYFFGYFEFYLQLFQHLPNIFKVYIKKIGTFYELDAFYNISTG